MGIVKVYTYKGAVMHYNIVVAGNWSSMTYATSKEKALSNFKYQFKKYAQITVGVGGIKLPGIILEKGELK